MDLVNAGWSKSQSPDSFLPPGEYYFQFRFLLPSNVPASYETRIGSWIRYTLGGRINRGYPHPDHTIETQLTVGQIVDINAPQLRLPAAIDFQQTACCLCCASGPVTTTLELPRTGYCVGEDIPFHVTVENGSRCHVRVTAGLEEHVTFYAEGKQHSEEPFYHDLLCSGRMEPRRTTVWAPEEPPLKIPTSAPTSLDSKLIKRTFILRIATHIPFVINNPFLNLKCPLTVGNVPYQSAALSRPPVGVDPLQPHPFVPPPVPSPGALAMPPSGHAPPIEFKLIKVGPSSE